MATEKLEQIKQYFVDPDRAETAEDLAQLSYEVIAQMAAIYVSGGNAEIGLDGENELYQVIQGLLQQENGTRRFDHKFMGQIHPQGNKVGILAGLIAAYMNNNTVVKDVSKAEHAMELEVTEWLLDMFGLPETGSGNITTGGTTANIAALWVAREAALERRRHEGLGYPPHKFLVLTNSMRHYSVKKAASMLGMGLIELPVKGYKTDLDRLETLLSDIGPDRITGRVAAIVGVAGETETGLVDNMEGLAELASRYGIWLHIDAAYGGPFILSRQGQLFNGISRADSVVVDPHKMLYTPYAAGVVLFRDRTKHALIQNGARYLARDENQGLLGDPAKRNFGLAARVEGSMGTGGVLATWATKRLLNEDGIRTILDHTLDLTETLYSNIITSPYLRPLHQPELNTLLVGLRPELNLNLVRREIIERAQKKAAAMNIVWDKATPEQNHMLLHNALVEQVQADADAKGYYVSVNDEVDHGLAAFRFVPTHPFTTHEHVFAMQQLLELGIAKYLGELEED